MTQSLIAAISCDESLDAKFILEVFKSWSQTKKNNRDSKKDEMQLDTDVSISEELGYLG